MSSEAGRLVENNPRSACLDLLGCMACYLAGQANSRNFGRADLEPPSEPARWPEFRDEARAVLVALERTVPNFTPRTSAVRDAIAQAEAGSKPSLVVIRGGIPRADW